MKGREKMANSINFYNNMKALEQKDYNNMSYWIELVVFLQSQFKYSGFEKSDPPPEFIEKCLITTGLVGIGKAPNGDLIACHGSLSGEPDYYYRGTQFEGVYSTGNISGTRGKDIVVGWNNSLYAPDLDVLRIESILAETDVSEKLNILFARLLRIPVVSDSKEKAALEESIKNLLNGNIAAFVSSNLFKEISEGKNLLNLIELSDVKEVDKLQYLVQYRENVMKRFYNRHGHSIQTTGKIAQQTTDEIHGMDSVSLVYPMNQLEFRKRMCEEVNEMFGRNWSVDFSDTWKENKEDFERDMTENGKDGEPHEPKESGSVSASDDDTE